MKFAKHTSFFLLVLINAALSQKSTKTSGYKCRYSCGNYINFVEDNITISAIEKHEVKCTFSFVKEMLPIYVLSREKYWHVIEHNYGPKSKTLGRKFMHPDKGEAIQWVNNGKCLIGKVCAPNSDCWGSGSDACYSDKLTDWVSEKSFKYLNMWWTTEWRQTCTMDWECKLISKKVPIHYNSEGEMFIVLDDDKVKIQPDASGLIIKRETYNVFIPTTPRERSSTVTLQCFKNGNDLLCEGSSEEMVKFESGTRCTVLGPSKYCLIEGEFNRIRDFGANVYASISDLNQVRDAFVVNQERDNYNMYIISLKLRKIQRILLDVVSSLAEKNPQILNGVLKGNYYSRHLTDWTYEVCNCNDVQNCEEREFHSEGIRFCGNKVNKKRISVFDVNKTIDYSIDDVFRFQGKEAHIVDAISEEEARGSEFNDNHASGTFWDEITKSMNPFSWISSSVGYIALVVAVLAYLKK